MKVNNINGTNDSSCRCASWLEHWVNYSGRPLPSICPELNCIQNPETGAHVQKDSATDKNWYIIPLCKKHSGDIGKSLNIIDIPLVPAKVDSTCGKTKATHSKINCEVSTKP